MNTQELREIAQTRTGLDARIKEVLVNELDLPIEPGQIDSDQPLFGRGPESDFLDTFEIVLTIEETFVVYPTGDNQHTFGSVNKLTGKIKTQS